MLMGNIMRILLWVLAPSFFFDRGIFDGSKSGGMYLLSTFRSPIFSEGQGSASSARASVGFGGTAEEKHAAALPDRRRVFELARKDRPRASRHPD
jgi:hypothetical protein